MEKLSPSQLRKLFHCVPETGQLFWRERTPEQFPAGPRQNNACSIWNSRYAGKEAFTAVNVKGGYRRGSCLGASLLAHKVIWAITYGEWPAAEIDHINGNRTDNRISNLRAVGLAENNKNIGLHPNSESGVHGVTRYRETKWRAQIRSGGVQRHLGIFDRMEDAIKVRLAAEVEAGFHPNHGKRVASQAATETR